MAKDINNSDILKRGVLEIIDKKSVHKKLLSGKKLRVKYGIDPTTSMPHLGHAVPIRKLHEFQKLGHEVIFIIGDYTAQIGDPTGKSKTREMLTLSETQANVKNYLKQAFLFLDKKRVEVHLQSEWYEKFKPTDFIALMAKTTKKQLMRHETFIERDKKNKSLGFHEMLYPLLMAYDSVTVKADIELGGLDQKFNFLLTRRVMEKFKLPPEDFLLMKYLPGIDGSEKMSKSQGNYIGTMEDSSVKYRKLMSIQDKDIEVFFELLSDCSLQEIKQMTNDIKNHKFHPMEAKKKLALEIVSFYHGRKTAETVAEEFKRVFQEKKLPKELPQLFAPEGTFPLIDFLTNTGLINSRRIAKRLIRQGAIEIDGEQIKSLDSKITFKKSAVIRVGKKALVRLLPKS